MSSTVTQVSRRGTAGNYAIGDEDNFAFTVGDVEFGAIGGTPYNLLQGWSKEDQTAWANHQILYYSRIVAGLLRWSALVNGQDGATQKTVEPKNDNEG